MVLISRIISFTQIRVWHFFAMLLWSLGRLVFCFCMLFPFFPLALVARFSTQYTMLDHWNQKVGWIASGFPQQGFWPPASDYNIFFELKTFFPYSIIYLIVSEFIWLYLNLFALGPPCSYQAIHSNTSCDKQMCFKSFHHRSSTFDNTRKYDNSWQLGSNSAAGLGKVVVRLR